LIFFWIGRSVECGKLLIGLEQRLEGRSGNKQLQRVYDRAYDEEGVGEMIPS
jgi:hypothetical protein